MSDQRVIPRLGKLFYALRFTATPKRLPATITWYAGASSQKYLSDISARSQSCISSSTSKVRSRYAGKNRRQIIGADIYSCQNQYIFFPNFTFKCANIFKLLTLNCTNVSDRHTGKPPAFLFTPASCACCMVSEPAPASHFGTCPILFCPLPSVFIR